MFNNPILPGFNPDPSICKANGKYYIVVSTFEYFPGLPIYSSDNLITWEFCCFALTKKEHLDLSTSKNSAGLYAPTIRYHDNQFYIVCTNKATIGNFLITTKNILGPWSEPISIGTKGIDPSLFWDDDGSCFYCSTGSEGNVRGIIGYYLDVQTGKALSTPRLISRGNGGHSVEGPHIFKKEGYYYLLTAEGGTEYNHHETIARSTSLTGPYEGPTKSTILSQVGEKENPVQATGHVDMFQDEDNNWYAVFLGIRKFGKALLHNLGRETFMEKVSWSSAGWPVIGSDGITKIISDTRNQVLTIPFDAQFDAHPWQYLRYKRENYFRIAKETLIVDDHGDRNKKIPALLCYRQTAFSQVFSVSVDTEKSQAEYYGVTAFYNSDYHYDLVISDRTIVLAYTIHGLTAIQCKTPISGNRMHLEIMTDRESYSFFCNDTLVGRLPIAGLCTETTMYMTFTGTLFGLFSYNGKAVFIDGLTIKTLEGNKEKSQDNPSQPNFRTLSTKTLTRSGSN
ncbi:beta-xylosidase [Sphaerochaeta pleomorpha str. Grapes]|uniref:Beta-xylosidase n=1 Tax=Sphaerochaeta pleomorpha (strain ATCC BAA-1885 / DSM 22778 / Grapes) TaxID=158190 RepID=G8QY35_SPHPG|nr:glycoside hydrolase family 43 protein [Sphaerochaeta pleomorpha]AEV29600.1 beta-xylosidase [Sphaerochaeta pleomorpha str. Grapes]